MPRISIRALPDIAEIVPGDDLAAILGAALDRLGHAPATGDALVVAQKIVSKAEGRFARLDDVTPGACALELARETGKDARLVELILSESSEVLRAVPHALIVRHRLGFVLANAGIDQSNIGEADARVLLLPLDPDASAKRLRAALPGNPAVIISDSFGRAWRIGTVNTAIGAAGLPSLIDRRGERDRFGRTLQATEIAYADAVAAAAGLAIGEAAEGTPAALITGLAWSAESSPAASLIRPLTQDLFR